MTKLLTAELSSPIRRSAEQEYRLNEAKTLITRLRSLAEGLHPHQRRELDRVNSDQGQYADIPSGIDVSRGGVSDYEKLAKSTPLESIHVAGNVQELTAQPANVRAELYRRKLISTDSQRANTFGEIKNNTSLEVIDLAISFLRDTALSEGEQTNPSNPFQEMESTTPKNTLLLHALLALRNQKIRENHDAQSWEVSPEIAFFQGETRRYVLGLLNPSSSVSFINVSDVYGEQRGVTGANDNTNNRVAQHRHDIGRKFGVSNMDIFDQGSSIECPEQCGFFALTAINQERRSALPKRIASKFIVLNNAARTKSGDGIEEGAAKSKSSSLLYFTFDLGDGVIHRGIAYGHQTLTHLKSYVKDLYEIDDTSEGSQFRSLEIQQHLAIISCLGDGAFPAHKTGKPVSHEEIPELNLASNEAQFLGYDTFGNGITSKPASVFFNQFLAAGEDKAKVSVEIHGRDGKEIIEPGIYVLARALGITRSGDNGLWESSTPTTENPLEGHLSIGKFMKYPGDTNEDVLRIPPGSIIKITQLPSRSGGADETDI